MDRIELIDLIKSIIDAEGTDQEIEQKIYKLKQNILDPQVTNYIFYDDLTPEQIVDKALKYNSIHL
ncbi:hypothetical protein [Spirosoma foliorum]|uniref:Bacteriocin immunity protein n=1 Tax=Spirosoma foliorum TaxID=2710596 RepID=A0A7G5GQJ7_9BACT|nr:hypothetical protein [Spirosoma foliorum]QMW01139.1 hypothetical protein H3H32_24640 [Spirosoma foliorum]